MINLVIGVVAVILLYILLKPSRLTKAYKDIDSTNEEIKAVKTEQKLEGLKTKLSSEETKLGDLKNDK